MEYLVYSAVVSTFPLSSCHLTCPGCSFRSRLSYLEHQTARHSQENLIQCPVCSERFRLRVCLDRHMKVGPLFRAQTGKLLWEVEMSVTECGIRCRF